jgi:hypothetical protein
VSSAYVELRYQASLARGAEPGTLGLVTTCHHSTKQPGDATLGEHD